MPSSENSSRILKNTLMLYFRMIMTMVVSLYTSRVVLQTLGIEDFGIYNVVGGAVSMFAFLSSSASTATQRFLSFELAKKKLGEVSKVFSMSINIHILIAILIFTIGELIGVWFINYKLNIPIDRINAANWVFQFTLLSLIVSFICIPFNALIIAEEKMQVFAYISIVEVSLKLLIVYLLQLTEQDKLPLYAVYLFAISLVVSLIYIIYCRRKFSGSRYIFSWDKSLFKDMARHSNWMLLGTTTSMLSSQGVNMLINIFFGVTLNAARGIAYQVYTATNQFVANFMVAVQPQIIKFYAKNETEQVYKLIFSSSKLSFFLTLLIALPIIVEADLLLKWWLKTVPEEAILFTRLVIADLFFTSLYAPIATLSQASGKIGLYQTVIAIGFLSVFLITWLFYILGFPAYSTFVVMIVISFVTLFSRLWVLKVTTGFPVKYYCLKVLLRVFGIASLSSLIPIAFKSFISNTFIQFSLVVSSSLLISSILIWLVGLEENEKYVIYEKLKKIK